VALAPNDLINVRPSIGKGHFRKWLPRMGIFRGCRRKNDNGSHFTGEAVADLLAAHRVKPLVPPPCWPRYNGSGEAGIHALKDRTAARADHPGYWTWDDTAGAVVGAAELARPRGPSAQSPLAMWQARGPIPVGEREWFEVRVADAIPRGRVAEEVRAAAEVARKAIRRALEGCGYHRNWRRSILPPITRRKAASNPSGAHPLEQVGTYPLP
jgi:hypothetical protein